MRLWITCCCLAALLTGCGSAETDQHAIAFTHVNVVPMDRERVIADQTVVVREDAIVAIGDADHVPIPKGATVIDAHGQYLLPGLADMHVHVQSESELLLAVAHGVTTLRDMFGSPYKIVWRERIARGELLGPTLIVAGPIVDGAEPAMSEMARVVTEADAERVVAEQQQRGYDFVKVYHHLSASAYHAVLAAAPRHDLPVAGHVAPSVGLEAALRAGQRSIEHLDGYVDAMQRGDSPYSQPAEHSEPPGERFLQSIRYVDEARIADLVAATRAAGVWNCPTLIAYRDWGLTSEESVARFALPQTRLVHPMLRVQWTPANQADIPYSDQLQSQEQTTLMKRRYALHAKLTKALVDADAGVMLGTDAGVPFVIPGIGALEELALLVDAGLTPYQALRTATAAPAEFLHQPGGFGTVRVGARADLILLTQNPLRDVAALHHRVGVMLRGHWLSEQALQQRLAATIADYDAPRAWLTDMSDASVTEHWDRQLRFAISSLGIAKGEERVMIRQDASGEMVVVAQHQSIEPQARYTVRYARQGEHTHVDIDSAGREGVGQLDFDQDSMHVRVRGAMPVIGAVTQDLATPAHGLLETPGMAWSVWLYPHVASLAIKDTVEIPVRLWDYGPAFALTAHAWTVTRQQDDVVDGKPVRVYEIAARDDIPLSTSYVRFDQDGMPVSLELGSGEGVVRYTRISG
jgi:imidazolonepropionase-like amidohydrolase